MKTIEAFSWANFALCGCTHFTTRDSRSSILQSRSSRSFLLHSPPGPTLSAVSSSGRNPSRRSRKTHVFRPWSFDLHSRSWFGEFPGYEGNEEDGEGGESRPTSMRYDPRYPHPMMFQQPGAPGAGGFYPGMQPMAAQLQPGGGGYVIQQQPGHSVVIQQGQNGMPQFTQVPGIVQQA
jgi:hypothetical protein